MIEMEVRGLTADPKRDWQVLWMRGKGRDDVVVVMIVGDVEARAIATTLSGKPPDRPVVYDLFKSVLDHSGARLTEIRISAAERRVAGAQLVFARGEERIRLDAPLSDAVVLALTCRAPIRFQADALDRTGAGGRRGATSAFLHVAPVNATSRCPSFEPDRVSEAIAELLAETGVDELLRTDRSHAERRKALESRLMRAVALEHYEEAALLKRAIERLEVEL